MQYDLIIIGGGPGGYTAAFEAADRKMRVCLFEEREAGGTCLNRGCIPTKTLVHTADLYRELKSAQNGALCAESLRIDIGRLNEKKEQVIGVQREGLEKQLKARKIEVIRAHACITDEHTVTADGTSYTAENILIAAGSVPARLPVEGADLPGVITSDDILRDIPQFERLIIIGGGVIGCEIAGIYEAFGTAVTVIEAMDTLLPAMDSEIGRSLALIFKKRGIDTHVRSFVQKIEKTDSGLTVTYEEKGTVKTAEADAVLLAAGRRAVTDVFAGEKPEMNRGRFVIDEQYRTSFPHIYAVGDAAGSYPQLAHTAEAMAVNAVRAMLNEPPGRDMSCIPAGVYTCPEIASVGLTEKEAAAAGISAVTGKANTLSNARSLIQESERGFIKITAEKESGRILGAVMMCERATDLIQEMAAAVSSGMTVGQLLKVIHGHPTFAEAVVPALEAAVKKLQ
ncbi:MAG: dihydrolipoyl dehydrogenase [Solobacterium sp.]|nr:dihydrolipoyl dehydrogenase [Solobacterium sp.]